MMFGRGEKVYHVAHPDVPAVITDINEPILVGGYNFDFIVNKQIKVTFSKPVEFELARRKGTHKEWTCSRDLLHPTPALARANHDPEWREKFLKEQKDLSGLEKFIRNVRTYDSKKNDSWSWGKAAEKLDKKLYQVTISKDESGKLLQFLDEHESDFDTPASHKK